ncbi:MAG: universal stress protein [Pseudolabrys sp.]
MLKRILVLLGETAASDMARRYAFKLAQEANAELAGLAGVDLAAIEAPMPGALGAGAFKVRLEQQLRQQASDKRARLREVFERECRGHNVPFEWLSFDGDPLAALYLATETRDLVVTGHDTGFEGNVREALSPLLAKLLLTGPRPVIATGDTAGTGDDVLVAYDGSIPSMRAVQMFALLGLRAGQRLHVISIDPEQELAVRRVTAAAAYLRFHGYDVSSVPVTTKVAPAEVMAIEVSDRKIGTIVMGAYGHRGFREFLFGSTTVNLTEAPPCALFICH